MVRLGCVVRSVQLGYPDEGKDKEGVLIGRYTHLVG